MENAKNYQLTQIEEIYAIHCIYYPVKILNYGGVGSDRFPVDCMSEADYDDLSDQSNFATNVKLNESSIKGAVRSELIRFCFRLSPSLDTEESVQRYSFIDVTFPKTYPAKSPYIVIKMTVPMSSDHKRRFTNRLMQLLRKLSGSVCVFEVCMLVNDVMATLLSDEADNLWDDLTSREESEELRTLMETATDSCEDNYDPFEDSAVMEYSETENAIHSEDENYKYTEMDFPNLPIWSVQSIVQTPVWYENVKNMDQEGQTFEPEKRKKSSKASVPKLKLTSRTIENDYSPQNSITAKDIDDHIKSLLNVDMFFTHDSAKNLNAIKRSLKEFVNDTYDRYERDFVENDYLYETAALSLCSVRHVLDQNLYYIKIFHIPRLCPYVNLSNEDVRMVLHSFRVRRRLILNEMVSKVSQLSKLEHNSICRYYQSWMEKKLNESDVSNILTLCDDILQNRSFSSLTRQADSDERMILLFKHVAELGDYYVYELVTERNLFVQIQNFNCHTLRYEIENNNLHRNVERIWSFMRHLLDVLTYLHQNNVYHQALSLDNIYVHTDLYGTGLKISEFGITHLARKLFLCEYECTRKNCECHEYRKSIRKHLYKSHPSDYGLSPVPFQPHGWEGGPFDVLLQSHHGPQGHKLPPSFHLKGMASLKTLSSSEIDDLDFDEAFDPFAAVQEDMFALGLIIFKMWHPPLDDISYQDVLAKVINTQTFPDYFLTSTPPIIITTLTRLLSRDTRPTAVELLRETLVPPVVDIYMYKQYLRKLENPLSEESLDALKFLLTRDWKSDVSKYRHKEPIETLAHTSYITHSLERFMRSRGVIIRPPLPLQIKTDDNTGGVLGIDGTNTVFSVGGSIRQSLLRSFELYSSDDSGIGVKQFSVGDVYGNEGAATGAVFSITMKIETDLTVPKSLAKKGLDYKSFDDNGIMMVSTQVDLIIIAIESIQALNLGFEAYLTITFQPLIVDFLSMALGTTTDVASVIFSRLQSTDINEYTFKMLLDENSIVEADVKSLVDILSNRFTLLEGLKRLHLQVLTTQIPEIYQRDYVMLYQEIVKLVPGHIEEFHIQTGASPLEDELVFERYYRRMLYMIEMTKMLQTLRVDSNLFIEFVLGAHYTEMSDYCVNFPFFLGFMSDSRRNLVMTGGCYGTNTCFLEPTNVSKLLHFDLQYFLDDLVKLSIKDSPDVEGYTIAPTKTDKVDVIITCQTVKLLPAAASIANKLIDAGLSCECRAIPLIFTGDFNQRLRMVDSVKARVHLQKLTNTGSEELPLDKSHNESTYRSLAEDEGDDRAHFNILYHVEPINGSFGQARKIDNEVALVHFIIGQLT